MYKNCSLKQLVEYADKKSMEVKKPFDKFFECILDFAKSHDDIIINGTDIYIPINNIIKYGREIANNCFKLDYYMGYFTILQPIVCDQIMVIRMQ